VVRLPGFPSAVAATEIGKGFKSFSTLRGSKEYTEPTPTDINLFRKESFDFCHPDTVFYDEAHRQVNSAVLSHVDYAV
jgi:hypothetical protein